VPWAKISNFSQAVASGRELRNGNCLERKRWKMTTNSFIGALQTGGPASDRADKMTLYG
jgi:hypothetical protein